MYNTDNDKTIYSFAYEFLENILEKFRLGVRKRLNTHEFNEISMLHVMCGQVIIADRRKQLWKKRTKRIREDEERILRLLDEAKSINNRLKDELGLDDDKEVIRVPKIMNR